MYSDEGLTPEQVAVLDVLAPRWKPGVGARWPIYMVDHEPPTDEQLLELVDRLVAALRVEKPPVADGWYRYRCGTCGTVEVTVASPAGKTSWQATCVNGHAVHSMSFETSVVDPQHLYVSKPPPKSHDDWTVADGRANMSEEFERIRDAVERIIRSDARNLLAGRAGQTARLVVSTLAHRYGLAPHRRVDARPEAAVDARTLRVAGDYVVGRVDTCTCATGPNDEHQPHCGEVPVVALEELYRLGFVGPFGTTLSPSTQNFACETCASGTVLVTSEADASDRWQVTCGNGHVFTSPPGRCTVIRTGAVRPRVFVEETS